MVSDMTSETDLQAVVEKHTGLVKSVALRLARIYGEDPEDLIQIGYIGLLKAAKRFDPERGLQFSTYAVPMITGEIRSQLRDQGSVKMSRQLKADVTAVRRAESNYSAKYGTSPHLSQLAELAGLTEERVQAACQAADVMGNIQPLDSLDTESSQFWLDEEEKDVSRIDLADTLRSLDPKARQVIVLRYYRDCTQQQIADMMGISQVQVCRIEKKTLQEMARRMSG